MAKSSFFGGTGISATNSTAIESSTAAAAASETAAAASAASAATSASSASANVATNAASAAASEASRQAAVSAKTSAETAETNAETAQAAALVSKNASAVSATASEASKVTSANSAATATTKASEASTSETNAAASAATATSKASDSETARAASVVAKDASVVAKNESVVAKDASVVAKNAAVAAQAAAETAETNLETAETNSANSATASANSATASANSATASEASKVTSVNSASTATTKASEASTSAASAAASYDFFDDRMLGAKSSAPTVDNDGGALVQGTLYFDTSSQTMKVYGSSGWVPAGSSVNGTSARFKFVATNNQTTFSGSDANSQTLGYDAGFLDVYLSGLRLVNGTDFTATTGTNIVLASGAATGDILEVVAYGTFVLANFNADKLDGQHGSYYTGYTDTAVSNLVDSSPAALNTLNELAAALGDDVNFSTTVNNSIATKAPLASPTFTGTTTIPTIDINAGTIDGTTVGASSASTGAFTTLSASGDVNFDSGTLFVDASANKVGLGTASPNYKLEINHVGDDPFALVTNDETTVSSVTGLYLRSTSEGRISFGSGAALTFSGNGGSAEKMRIDGSSGALLVGKTSEAFGTQGLVFRGNPSTGASLATFTRNGENVVAFNRLNSDGSLLNFHKDGTTVGSIGTTGGDLLIGTGNTGLQFYDATPQIIPRNTTGANVDATVDLGASGSRFKDLYLSGGVYLGGTGAANKLDDVETGTWTPTVGEGTVQSAGWYIKVGDLVTIHFAINSATDSTSTEKIKITNIPFNSSGTIQSSHHAQGSVSYLLGLTGLGIIGCIIKTSEINFITNSTITEIRYSNASGSWSARGTITYKVA